MSTETNVRLPDDSANTGKKVRTHSQTVGGDVVHTHVFVPAVDAIGSGDDAPVSNSNPMPSSVVSSALPTGAATEATLAALDPLTDAELRATPVPVSGPLTDTELRAAAVPVSGPLTDAQLRATAVPVSVAALPLPSGAATESTLATRLSESDFDTKVGSLTETAPATDTASSGLNGRLQRIAQRLSTLVSGIVLAAGSALIGKVQLRNPGDTADMGDATTPVRTDPTGTTTQPILLDSAASILGPLVNNDDMVETELFEATQNSLAVCLMADGTVVEATIQIQTMDSLGNLSDPWILTSDISLTVLRAIATGPYRKIRATLVSHTFGTATELNIAIITSQADGVTGPIRGESATYRIRGFVPMFAMPGSGPDGGDGWYPAKLNENDQSQLVSGTVTVHGTGDATAPVCVFGIPNESTDTFIAPGNGTSEGTLGMKYHSLQVTATGAVTSWDVRLEGSLDGNTWTQILQHTNTTGSGVTVPATTTWLVKHLRTRCAAITLGAGTNVVATRFSGN